MQRDDIVHLLNNASNLILDLGVFGALDLSETGHLSRATAMSIIWLSIPSENLNQNSSSSLAKLRNALAIRFPNTGVRTSCPAVVVPFGTDAKETTEVTPAYYRRATKNFSIYGIPDCAGKWMNASPDAHNEYVRSVDNKLSSKVKPLIRFIKAWKYLQNVPISSFYLELRVAKYASDETSIVYSIDIKQVFSLLDNIDLEAV